jgi:hypothetical protein
MLAPDTAKPALDLPGNGLQEVERFGGRLDGTDNTSHQNAEGQKRLRLHFLAISLHALGPKPLFHFLDEVERGADLRSHLERYAALPADFIRALGGDRFAPALRVIDEGGR